MLTNRLKRIGTDMIKLKRTMDSSRSSDRPKIARLNDSGKSIACRGGMNLSRLKDKSLRNTSMRKRII